MSLLSEMEVLRLKLATIPAKILKKIVRQKGVKLNRVPEMIKFLIEYPVNHQEINGIIKTKYAILVNERQNIITDKELLLELEQVNEFHWGVIQGQLDNKIQVNYVRKYCRYFDLINHIESELYGEIKNYVICTWYNHWTTVIIEDIISRHPKVIPTLKNVKGIDIFFDNQPFDLKITYMPNGYTDFENALNNPKDLIIWLYENQGEQRFGADNRLFVILFDRQNPENSWKIKRDVALIQSRITEFFNNEKVTNNDEVVFKFKRNTYTAISKLLFITK